MDSANNDLTIVSIHLSLVLSSPLISSVLLIFLHCCPSSYLERISEELCLVTMLNRLGMGSGHKQGVLALVRVVSSAGTL